MYYKIHKKPGCTPRKHLFTNEKHFSKALKHLDKIVDLFRRKHNVQIPEIKIKSSILKQNDLKHFLTVE